MRRTSRGFTLVEILIVIAIIGIIAATALPWLIRARMNANEASAIGSLRSIISSQQNYASSAARGGYARSLPQLGAPCPGSEVPFLSSDLTADAEVNKSGFYVTMAPAATASDGPTDCKDEETSTGFYVSARAMVPGSTATRAFAGNAEGTIWENVGDAGETPPAEGDMTAAGETDTVHPLR